MLCRTEASYIESVLFVFFQPDQSGVSALAQVESLFPPLGWDRGPRSECRVPPPLVYLCPSLLHALYARAAMRELLRNPESQTRIANDENNPGLNFCLWHATGCR